jgi:hypothetical protein
MRSGSLRPRSCNILGRKVHCSQILPRKDNITMKICKKNICYVDLKIYYKITIRGPTLIFADYCLALLGQLLIKK